VSYSCVSEWHGYIWVSMVLVELCLWLMSQIGLFGCCGNQVTLWLGLLPGGKHAFGYDGARFMHDVRGWFVRFVWLPCFEGIAHEC